MGRNNNIFNVIDIVRKQKKGGGKQKDKISLANMSDGALRIPSKEFIKIISRNAQQLCTTNAIIWITNWARGSQNRNDIYRHVEIGAKCKTKRQNKIKGNR